MAGWLAQYSRIVANVLSISTLRPVTSLLFGFKREGALASVANQPLNRIRHDQAMSESKGMVLFGNSPDPEFQTVGLLNICNTAQVSKYSLQRH